MNQLLPAPTDAQIAELAVECGLPYDPGTWEALKKFAYNVPCLTAEAQQRPDLHGQIMNIPCEVPKEYEINQVLAYKFGHRDARHAAAELAAFSRTMQAAPLSNDPVKKDSEQIQQRLCSCMSAHQCKYGMTPVDGKCRQQCG